MDPTYPSRLLKHSIKKLVGLPDPAWPFYSFEHGINPQTIARYPELHAWAEQAATEAATRESAATYESSSDPVVVQGHRLRKEVMAQFQNKYSTSSAPRVMVQIPDPTFSPGGFSAFSNFLEALTFLGVPAFPLQWADVTEEKLAEYQPNVFLITDHADFLARVDWDAIAKHKTQQPLHIGLLAHLEEYGNSPLAGRLAWAKEHDVSFYFSFRNEEYVKTRFAYAPFFEQGYEILPLEFGANILTYYPVPGIERDIDYVFLGSTNPTKGARYKEFGGDIVAKYPGFIDGPGWKHVPSFTFNKNRDRYVYARGKIGLNFHLTEQVEWACEVNERTHQLAICGIPQVIDNPTLLPRLYSPEALCSANNRKEYEAHFTHLLRDPDFATTKALQAQKEAFEKHTTFHRADTFITRLLPLVS